MTDSVKRPPDGTYTELPDAAPHDPRVDGPHVLAAYQALVAEVGERSDRRYALNVLAKLPEYDTLTPQETVAVLLRFPGRGDKGLPR